MAKRKPQPDDANESPAPETGYTVLARRYRPQTFADLVGQEPVARALINALSSNRVAHAYLFTGPRGVGKTSTARILAKALNCVKGPTSEPCGVCDICRAIASGDDVDVLEFDAASNRGIDEIRNIRNNVQYRPSRSRFKIYIIDEVHMLTVQAFNALLKTLEEPPPHVKFIFATTDAQKIPVTILSRCQRFDLAGIPLQQIQSRLAEIVRGEGLEADDEALEMIARRAGGSMRDAQSLLDQLLAFGDERLTADQVHHLLGTAGFDRVLNLAAAVLAGDARLALERLDEAVQNAQLGELLDQLMAYWRDLMVGHVAGETAADLSVPRSHRETLLEQAQQQNLDAILAGLDVLATTRARLQRSAHGRTLIEMALVRLCRLGELISLTQLRDWVARAPAGTTTTRPAATANAAQPPEAVKKKSEGAAAEPVAPATTALTEETLPQLWPEIMRTVGRMMASEVEKAGIPAIFGPNTLVLRFPPEYNAAREYCQEPGRVARLEEAVQKRTGQRWLLRVDASSSSAAPPPVEPPRTMPPRPRRNPREEAEKEPLIKRALDVLGAQIVRVDDGFDSAPAERPTSSEGT
jgi:DNA polymerase-3 subunit gamma/tau